MKTSWLHLLGTLWVLLLLLATLAAFTARANWHDAAAWADIDADRHHVQINNLRAGAFRSGIQTTVFGTIGLALGALWWQRLRTDQIYVWQLLLFVLIYVLLALTVVLIMFVLFLPRIPIGQN